MQTRIITKEDRQRFKDQPQALLIEVRARYVFKLVRRLQHLTPWRDL